jgi:hypothetical protein
MKQFGPWEQRIGNTMGLRKHWKSTTPQHHKSTMVTASNSTMVLALFTKWIRGTQKKLEIHYSPAP